MKIISVPVNTAAAAARSEAFRASSLRPRSGRTVCERRSTDRERILKENSCTIRLNGFVVFTFDACTTRPPPPSCFTAVGPITPAAARAGQVLGVFRSARASTPAVWAHTTIRS